MPHLLPTPPTWLPSTDSRWSGLTRRGCLQLGGLSLFGTTLPQLLAGRAVANDTGEAPASSSFGRAKACILLFMWGGPGHQDTWDLKPQAPAEVRGEFKPIATNVPGIDVCEHFPLLARQTDRLAIIRSMTHTNVDHTAATHFLLTGQPPLPGKTRDEDWPHIGSVLSRLKRGRDPLPPFVSMRPKVPGDVPRFVEESRGQFAGWIGSVHDPLTIDANPNEPDYRVGDFELLPGVDGARLAARRALLQGLERDRRFGAGLAPPSTMSRHYTRSFELLDSTLGPDAFNLDREPAVVRERYGRNPHGQSVLQARRLVERGVPLVTCFWPSEGIKNVSVYWDTHSRNFLDHKTRLMPPADQAFTALLDDLADRGLLDETLIVWTGEFGRTPKVGQRNSDAGAGADGRDHWPNCFTTVLAGGGVRGGTVYGASDKHAAYPAVNAVAPVDLVATVYHALGVPPDLALTDSANRPQVICPGVPLHDVLV